MLKHLSYNFFSLALKQVSRAIIFIFGSWPMLAKQRGTHPDGSAFPTFPTMFRLDTLSFNKHDLAFYCYCVSQMWKM